MAKNKLGIFERYCHEIEDIMNMLQDLQNNRYYEHTGVPSDGGVAHNASKLRKKLDELLRKIDNQETSDIEEIADLM